MPPDVIQSTTMSKKGTIEVFQTKISRNDRFAQMSHQEKLIEQKKREIQAKLEQKMKAAAQEKSSSSTSKGSSKSSSVANAKPQEKKPFNFNTFSNDGSFLNQFKQMKDKKLEQKLKTFKSREGHDRYSDDRNKSKWKRDNQQQQKDNVRPQKVRTSRFSTEKPPAFETKINISTSYTNLISQPNFDGQSMVTAQDVTGQPLLKNLVTPQTVQYPLSPQNATPTTVIAAPPLLLNVPPPQIQLTSIEMVDLVPTTVITTVTLPQNAEGGIITVPPPPCLPALELSSIPPPNPIQVHNIPQPEPINALAIPPPAPLQVQNIPPPSPIQLNEIPNPKPLDILSIPTPNEKNMSDPDFLKNVPPPNKSVPPPSLQEGGGNVPTCIPPPNVMPPTTMPPPPPQLHQNLLIPPPQPVTIVTPQPILQLQSVTLLPQQPTSNPPPAIPPLMSQTILPPPGLGIVPPPPINMNCPPPLLQNPQVPPPGFMNLPPPPTTQAQNVKDMNAGTADYEAMASLGRVVAQCGPGIEDFVRHRKSQDPTLWFLFHKESAAYRQYQQLIAAFEEELRGDGQDYRPEDIYEPDGYGVEDDSDAASKEEKRARRKKRKSRWGDKEEVPPPGVIGVAPVTPGAAMPTGSVVLSKITRSDPGLLHYAANTFGSTNLSEEEWKKAEDHYKLNILYQDMVRKREEVERLKKSGQNKYEYDSDEDIDGGTWEHKVRQKEMVATQIWANELTRQAEGKHHIGDFLPPEEFKKFMEKSQAAKEGRQLDVSDYKEFKLKEDNIGFKMLQKLGWSEGTGLGTEGKGILEPVNKGNIRDSNQGLGLDQPSTVDTNDDEYDAYRKRMMLAYRFRPNPLNNPRRPYY